MPFTQTEAERLTTVEAVSSARGRLKLWKRGQEVMVEIYGHWGTLLGHVTVDLQGLREATQFPDKSRIIGRE